MKLTFWVLMFLRPVFHDITNSFKKADKTGKSQMINGYITEADFDRVYERAYHSRTPDTHIYNTYVSP